MSDYEVFEAVCENWLRSVQEGIAFPDKVEVHASIGVLETPGLHYYASVAPCNEHRVGALVGPILKAMRENPSGAGLDTRVIAPNRPQVFRMSAAQMDAAYFAGYNVLRYDSGWHELTLWGNNVYCGLEKPLVPLDSIMVQAILDSTVKAFLINDKYEPAASRYMYKLADRVLLVAQNMVRMRMLQKYDHSMRVNDERVTWEMTMTTQGHRDVKCLTTTLDLKQGTFSKKWSKDLAFLYPELYSPQHLLTRAGLLGA